MSATRAADVTLEQWDDLADRVEAPPWVRPGWAAAWARAFGVPRQVLVTIRRADRLVALAWLQRRAGNVRSPTNYHTPEYAWLALDEDAASALAAAVLRVRARRVAVAFVEADSLTHGLVTSAAASRGRTVVCRVLERSPFVDTSRPWQRYLSERDPRLVRDLRRRWRRLSETGSLVFTVEDGRRHLDRVLADFLRVEATGWKAAAATAVASSPVTRDFYREIARWAAARGELRVLALRLDGRMIAVQLCLQSAGVMTVLKLGHDDTYARFAPGKLLVREAIRHCCESGIARFDFSGQDARYKLEWTASSRELLMVETFARSPLGAVERAARLHGRPLAHRLLRGRWR